MENQAVSDRVEELVDYLVGPNVGGSLDRASVLMAVLADESDPAVVWAVFSRVWPVCEACWLIRDKVVALLHRAGVENRVMGDDCRAVYDALPSTIAVYRGSSAERVGGVSWCLESGDATIFSWGHPMARVRTPVLTRAEIRKDKVLTVLVDREETIILDPKDLTSITTEDLRIPKVANSALH